MWIGLACEALLMKKAQQHKSNSLYQLHGNALKNQGKFKTTVDASSRAVHQMAIYFD
jgi:hypothetical protein